MLFHKLIAPFLPTGNANIWPIKVCTYARIVSSLRLPKETPFSLFLSRALPPPPPRLLFCGFSLGCMLLACRTPRQLSDGCGLG